MASGTADLQRDLGGAIMQSIFGALLTAGYASAISAAIAASPDQDKITDSVQAELTKSFASAGATSRSSTRSTRAQITAAAKESFLQGDEWAYTAGWSRSCSAPPSCSSCSRGRTRKRRCSRATGREDSGAAVSGSPPASPR